MTQPLRFFGIAKLFLFFVCFVGWQTPCTILSCSDSNCLTPSITNPARVCVCVCVCVQTKLIQRSQLDGTGQEAVVVSELHSPDGVAVDWIARNVHWTDTGSNRIEVARLDGTARKVGHVVRRSWVTRGHVGWAGVASVVDVDQGLDGDGGDQGSSFP